MFRLTGSSFMTRGVLLTVVIALALVALCGFMPAVVHGYSACEQAEKYEYRNSMWNFLCDMEILFEYYFMSGEV